MLSSRTSYTRRCSWFILRDQLPSLVLVSNDYLHKLENNIAEFATRLRKQLSSPLLLLFIQYKYWFLLKNSSYFVVIYLVKCVFLPLLFYKNENKPTTFYFTVSFVRKFCSRRSQYLVFWQ